MRKQPRASSDNYTPTTHRSYILRLWCAGEPGTAEWHASLEDAATKERYGFSSLEQLFTFLMEMAERDGGLSFRS